jgi:hypothetical protein
MDTKPHRVTPFVTSAPDEELNPDRFDDCAGPGENGSLWTVEPAVRPRMPDPVRTAAVRAFLIASVALILAVMAVLCTLAGTWLAFPATLGAVVGTVAATWSVLDVWVTRQVWNQRHGVVSTPSSTARALRREQRRARHEARLSPRARTSSRRLSQA